MRVSSVVLLVLGLAVLHTRAPAAERSIIYEVSAGTVGNQEFGGALGMDFDVDYDISVTRLGVFDSGSDGLQLTITARLYDRDSLAEVASLPFGPGDDGELVGGSRFKALETPVDLPAGSRCTIVAEGYGAGEPNGNGNLGALPLGISTGGCAVHFVGSCRYGVIAGTFPDTQDAGGAVHFAAGTLEIEPQETPTPRGATAYLIAELTAGNQEFSGALGMDFDVNAGIRVTRLGVFDSGSDGLARPITARLYDRDSLSEVASIEFTPADPGDLEGGSRFKALDPPLAMAPGFHGSMVAEGYGPGEPNGNGDFGQTIDSGGCAIDLVGFSRYGLTAGQFPDIVDSGPPNRYLAGTFSFELFTAAKPEPPTGVTAMLSDPGKAQIRWSAPTTGTPPAGYNVYQTRPARVGRLGDAMVTALELTVEGLLAGVDYCFVVRSVSADGLESVDSNEPCLSVPPGPAPGTTTIAYKVPAGTLGDQDFGGPLGMDFDVKTDIVVTRLGVFDSGSDGLLRSITARLYNRDTREELASALFTPEDPGEPVEGSLFKPLKAFITLPAGFHGTIEAEGYGADEMNGNQSGGVPLGTTTDGSGCAITFVSARYGTEAGSFPPFLSPSPWNDAFAAGTFEYGPLGAGEAPHGGTAYRVAEGTLGNQAFGGPVGMDFTVEDGIVVTRLGVFDDGSDGLQLPVTARLYDRDTLTQIVALDFTPDDEGELVEGSRFKDLDEPLELAAGFHGCIVAEGYGDLERTYNRFLGPGEGLTTDDGGCILSFVGGGRFSEVPGAFPDTGDVGPPQRYAAGTFVFKPSEGPPPGPKFHRGDANADDTMNITDGIYVLNFLFLGGPEPPCREAANANDDDTLNITDGIYILNFLFLGGPEPPAPGAPGAPCGPDPEGSPNDLGCLSYPSC